MQNSLESNLSILYRYQLDPERGELDPEQWSTVELLKRVQDEEDYYNDMSKPRYRSSGSEDNSYQSDWNDDVEKQHCNFVHPRQAYLVHTILIQISMRSFHIRKTMRQV